MKLFDEYCSKYVLPEYQGVSDYGTNAPSYYDHLAKVNQILKIMAKMVDHQNDILTDYIERLDGKIEGIDGTVLESLNRWITDGTIDSLIQQYIDSGILGKKLDKTEFESFKDSLLATVTGLTQTVEAHTISLAQQDTRINGVVTDIQGVDTRITTQVTELDTKVGANKEEIINRINKKFIDITQPPYNVPTDKTSDCSPAIQNALDNTPIRSTLYLPNGTYRCNTPLEMKRELTFIGQTAGENGGTTIRANFAPEHQNKILFHIHSTAKNSNIHNLYLGVTPESVTCHGIGNGDDGQAPVTHLNIENVWAVGFSSGFFFDKWYLSRLINCYAVGNFYGFMMTGESTSIIMRGCYANKNKDNYRLESMLYSTLISCGSDGATRYGYYFKKAKGVHLSACGVEDAEHVGIYVDSENESITFTSPFCVGSGASNNALASFIHVEPNNRGIVIQAPYEFREPEDSLQTSSIVVARGSQASITSPNVKLTIPTSIASVTIDGQRRSKSVPVTADGSFKIGDFVWNVGTTATILGWLCTASGTPGTWKEITTI